jgi:hypothetical protein
METFREDLSHLLASVGGLSLCADDPNTVAFFSYLHAGFVLDGRDTRSRATEIPSGSQRRDSLSSAG